jgi:uncharacterized zinc-type alcohol dehydrogenase-like protein
MLVGASPMPLEFNPIPLLFGGRRIVGSLVGGVPDTQALLDHCGKHSIVGDIELIEPEQINAAYERTLKGDVKYRSSSTAQQSDVFCRRESWQRVLERTGQPVKS